MERRLAAILAADIVGYTKLVERDTAGTVAAWRTVRAEVIDPAIAGNSGRIVKHTGDGFLAEFSTVLDAVSCAVGMQEALAAGPLAFRMGVSLGDVFDDGEDIYGEGVNIAARIEGLADFGGICISGGVYDLICNQVDHPFEDTGEHQVKHVSAPVRVWRWPPKAKSDDKTAEATEPPPIPALTLPDKPSIAVLPFDSLSNDPEQEYFADGMTEDLITDLSKISGIFVVARNSSFVFKGQPIDIREVARRLGVRYVLEGSVRKASSRVRINVQLIDAHTGGHLWAERYDGTVESVFELQDSVGAKVISALSVRLRGDEDERLKRVHTHNLSAYELYVRAKATPCPSVPERIEVTREMFNQVTEMDPDFAGGYAGVS